jgi:hypothetical protein
MNLAGSRQLKVSALQGIWYRAIPLQYVMSPLSVAHTKATSSRFNAGVHSPTPFEILYFTENHFIGLLETESLFATSGHDIRVLANPDPESKGLMRAEVNLSRVVDMSRESELRKIGTTHQELTGDWRYYVMNRSRLSSAQPSNIAPTQQLGLALYEAGYEGLLAPSSKSHRYCNLIVFPGNLMTGSHITCRDPGQNTHTLSSTTP